MRIGKVDYRSRCFVVAYSANRWTRLLNGVNYWKHYRCNRTGIRSPVSEYWAPGPALIRLLYAAVMPWLHVK